MEWNIRPPTSAECCGLVMVEFTNNAEPSVG